MLDKLAGFKTQIRILEKQLKEMDHSKLDSSKVKEVTEAIKNLKDLVKEKEDKREERKKKKEESSKPAEVEAAVVPTEVVKESSPVPTEEVIKEADVNKFAIDSRVEPIRGTAGSVGVVIREAGVNGDPLVYVKWTEGALKSSHGEYGAYYPTDLKLKAEEIKAEVNPDLVPRENLQKLEADLKSNYESMLADLHEEIKMAQDKGELTWVGRLEEKLSEIQKAYDEKYGNEKHADAPLKCDNCNSPMSPLEQQHLENLPNGDQKWNCNKKKAEDENGSGGTNKLKVYDLNPPYDKDPQEKSTGYGGDRPMGAMVAPNGEENSLPLESAQSYKPGIKARISGGSGIDSDKIVTIVDRSLVKTDGRGIPTNVSGAYKPVDWSREVAIQYEDGSIGTMFKNRLMTASIKLADLDLNSVEKRWALYVDGKLAIRTLTRSKADRVAKERFPAQLAAGKVEIKREDSVPVEATLSYPLVMDMSKEQLTALPTIHQGHTANLKFDDGKHRVWVSRLTKEDGVKDDNEIIFETLQGGNWVQASLNKQAINITVAEKLFVVNPMGKTAENEYHYAVSLADGSKLFKITSADEMGQEHLAYVIEKELTKEASYGDKRNHKKIEIFVDGTYKSTTTWAKTCAEAKEKYLAEHKDLKPEQVKCQFKKASLAKLTSNLAFLKKGSLVSIIAIDNSKKQIKFASLDNSLRGWAPMQKFAAMNVPEAKLTDHEGHKDEILGESGNELLVTCPSGSNNVLFRAITAPPATPESLNPDLGMESAKECSDCHGNFVGAEGDKCPTCGRFAIEKAAAGCDQCAASMINGVFCHETGCPNARKEREREKFENSDEYLFGGDVEASLNKEAHIRHEDGKWIVYNHDYTKRLGEYPSKEQATKRLREIEYFKSHKGSLQPLSKKEARKETKCVKCDKQLPVEEMVENVHGAGYLCKEHAKEWNKDASLKKADHGEGDCPRCGTNIKPGTEFCQTCKKHLKETFGDKKADQESSLVDQVQGFKDRMSAVTERLSNPPVKQASELDETSKGEDAITTSELIESLERGIDLLEGKTSDQLSPEEHHNLEEMENLLWKVEDSLGLSHPLPEHEMEEPEHAEETKLREPEFKEEAIATESKLEVRADDVNTPPSTLPPAGFRYAWDPKSMTWILVQITGAPGGGQ